jgi:hypothetical protein
VSVVSQITTETVYDARDKLQNSPSFQRSELNLLIAAQSTGDNANFYEGWLIKREPTMLGLLMKCDD